MRKLLTVLLAIGIIATFATFVSADQITTSVSSDVVITVYCHYHTSMTVTYPPLYFGLSGTPLNTNTTGFATNSAGVTTAVAVKNESPAFAASIMKVKVGVVSVPALWALGETLGDNGINKCVLYGLFAKATPTTVDIGAEDVLTTTARYWRGSDPLGNPSDDLHPATAANQYTAYPGTLVSVNCGVTDPDGHAWRRDLYLALLTPKASRLVSGGTITVRVTGESY